MPPGHASDSADASAALTSSLLGRLQARDSEGWERFLRLFGPLVYSWCRARWQLSATDAADILQEVVARVMETVADFRGGSFVAWLDAITRSRVANHFQDNPVRALGGSDAQHLLGAIPDRREGADALGSAQTSPAPWESDESAVGQLGGVLRRAVDAVRARCAVPTWQAFWQVTVQGRKPADVAGDLGMTANAVYIANTRILQRLRAELGALEKGPT
jgi:RNA polymerase sigma-70 factor (ECF subfamily)